MFIPSRVEPKIRSQKYKPLTNVLNSIFLNLPVPHNLRIWWNFGSCLGLILTVQLLSGLFISMHYCSDVSAAFLSVRILIVDVPGGWFLRLLHANGASFMFLCLYAHIGRGIYYGSASWLRAWCVGVLLFLGVMASAFLGYVLPWGQMSFWGATVITSLLSVFPYVGESIVIWLWGGFSINYGTLIRFYTLHFLLPFLVTGLVGLHLFFLHQHGSSNPLGLKCGPDKVTFHWYYSIKDIFGFCILMSGLLAVVFFFPYYLAEADNFIPADPLVTPLHIVPEWYFLFAYAILRSFTSPLGGVISLFASVLILFLSSFMTMWCIKSLVYYGPMRLVFWIHVCNFFLLTALGGCPADLPYTWVSWNCSLLYFSYFFVMPLGCKIWEQWIHCYRPSNPYNRLFSGC